MYKAKYLYGKIWSPHNLMKIKKKLAQDPIKLSQKEDGKER